MVVIHRQFNGPAHSGNGGYVCGLIATELGGPGPVTSTLRQPPPLDTALTWEPDASGLRLLTTGGAIVGEAQPGTFVREVPPAPTAEQAAAGEAAYPGHVGHPFGTCFTCGPDRAEGEGLRIFTGPITPQTTTAQTTTPQTTTPGATAPRTMTPGVTTVAGTWVPHPDLLDAEGQLAPPIVWAAIDCAGGWTADFTVHPTVLGRMTGQILRLPEIGEECTVTGRLDDHTGRKFATSTALYAGDELLARSEQIWIEIDPATF